MLYKHQFARIGGQDYLDIIHYRDDMHSPYPSRNRNPFIEGRPAYPRWITSWLPCPYIECESVAFDHHCLFPPPFMPIPSRYNRDAGMKLGDDSEWAALTANDFSDFRGQFLAGFHRESGFLSLEHVYYHL